MNIYLNKNFPYVYKLTHKVDESFYIGFRKANNSNASLDLGVKYFSSSKLVKEIGFENFKIEIIAEFFNENDAYDFEQTQIEENINNPLCLNKYFIKHGQKRFLFNKGHSIETKQKISLSLIGRNFSEATRQKMSHSQKGKTFSIITRNRMSISGKLRDNPMKGRKHSILTRQKMSKSLSGKRHSCETILKISNKLSGENNPRAKKWVIVNEAGEVFQIKALKPWCETRGINHTYLKKKSKEGIFYKGFKILFS